MFEFSKLIVFLFVITLFIYMIWVNCSILKFCRSLFFLMIIGVGLITLGTFLDVISSLTNLKLHIFIKISFTLGTIVFTVFVILSLNYIKKKMDILNKYAYIDIMTGVYNRKGIEEFFEEISKQKENFYIMFFDLDKTKVINDNLGHLIGDEYIRNSAKVIEDEIGMKGTLGRIGGDEFVAILQYTNEEELESVKCSIKKRVSEIFNEESINTSISIGYATYGIDGVDFKKLLSVADERMYEDKKNINNIIRCVR